MPDREAINRRRRERYAANAEAINTRRAVRRMLGDIDHPKLVEVAELLHTLRSELWHRYQHKQP